MELVQVVKENNKLRVRPIDPKKSEYNVRFPKDLRKEGKIFAVDSLEWVHNCWTAKGDIIEVVKKQVKKVKPEIPTWSIEVEYQDENWEFRDKVDPLIKQLAKVFKLRQPTTNYMNHYVSWEYLVKGTKSEARAIATLIKRDIKKKFPRLDLVVMHD